VLHCFLECAHELFRGRRDLAHVLAGPFHISQIVAEILGGLAVPVAEYPRFERVEIGMDAFGRQVGRRAEIPGERVDEFVASVGYRPVVKSEIWELMFSWSTPAMESSYPCSRHTSQKATE